MINTNYRVLRPEPTPYVFNFNRGARRWRDALGRVRDALPGGSTTQYGADVLVIGDSTSTFGTIYECWPHHLKVMLQDKYNRPGVQGGFGFMPFQTQNSTANDWTRAGAGWSGPQYHDVNNIGTGGFKDEAATSAGVNKYWRYYDPTQSGGVWKRQGVTDWQYIGVGGFGAPNYSSVYCDSDPGNGAFAASNNVANSSGGVYGDHWTLQTTLTITTPYTLQIASTGTDKAWACGVITYGNDYNEGIRLHNLSSVGSATDFWNGNSNILDMNIGNFCTGANGGSRNAKLILVNSMLNDCGSGASVNLSVATYKANLAAIIAYAIAKTSKPCVGLIVNQPWGYNTSDVAPNATALARYSQYRDACYQLALANPDTVFVIDFWKDLTYTGYLEYAPHGGDASVGGSLTDRGWYNDGTHLSAAGNAARARMLFGILSYGT